MKLIVRQFLQGLKERDGLDVLLPQLLSELGYEVLHHPKIGGRQAGVDVAVIGPDPDNNDKKSLLLLVIKSGNIDRKDWNQSQQAVRPSLEEVIDDYIPGRISPQYSHLPISVCVCMGGEIEEGIRSAWRGFVEKNSTDILNFREWNGDRIANLILSGVLSHELLDPQYQSHFQKAIALVSEPEESYLNFRNLLDDISKDLIDDKKSTTHLRQVLICLWILINNGIDSKNLNAPYRCCELALMHVWDLLNKLPATQRKRRLESRQIFDQIQSLYLDVSHKYLIEKIGPHCDQLYALSATVRSRSSIDVQLSIFETLGRMALLGLWHETIACNSDDDDEQENHLSISKNALKLCVEMINTNPGLANPIRDDHHIEIGLLMLLAQQLGHMKNVEGYFKEISNRLEYRYVRRYQWPTCQHDYHRLARHGEDRSDEYFKRSTAGSVLIPFMLVGLERLEAKKEHASLKEVVEKHLSHTTQQVWVPHEKTDEAIWKDGDSIGTAIVVPTMSLPENNSSLAEEIQEIVDDHQKIRDFEVFKQGLIPLFLTACRHHRLPLPPHFWF